MLILLYSGEFYACFFIVKFTNMLIYYLLGALAFWLSLITVFLVRTVSHYNKLTKDVSKKDLISSLNHLISRTDENAGEITKVLEKLEQTIKKDRQHLQKIGFHRYNPFTDTGGDQSFSICLLDENNDGFVISSLHSRENTRLYSKSIHGGQTENQVLSKEEQQVINQAIKQ